MNNNSAIVYSGKLITIKGNIEQLETLNIDTSNIQTVIEQIEKDTELKIKERYNDYATLDTNSVFSSLVTSIYESAIKKLDDINNGLILKYETYYQIHEKCLGLSRKLNDIEALNLSSVTSETLFLLKKIREAYCIDYVEAKGIVEAVYCLVYDVIKIELIYTNHSNLLEYVRESETDTSYITQLIKKDYESIGENDRSEELLNAFNKITQQGFDDIYFLNDNFIFLLNLEVNSKFVSRLRDRFLKQVEQYIDSSSTLKAMKISNLTIYNRISEIKKEKRKINLKRNGKKCLLLLNMALLGFGISKSIEIARVVAQDTEYKTVTTVTTIYDTNYLEEDTTVEYRARLNDSVSLIEYSAWEDPGYFRDDYTRNVYIYNLENLDMIYENVQDYFNPELKDLITMQYTVEHSTELPNDSYDGNKYVITKTIQDISDYHKVDDKTSWFLRGLMLSMTVIAIDFLIFRIFSKTKLSSLRQMKKTNKLELIENKNLLLEAKKQENQLFDELLVIKENVEKGYDELPTALKEDSKVKQKIRAFRDMDNN